MLSVDQLEDKLIDLAFAEDIGDGDHTTLCCIPEDAMGKSHLLIKEDGVLAGVEMAKKVFARFDPTMKVEVLIQDGTPVKKGDIAMIVEGKTRSLLQTERLMLNIMQRMSGIATMTAKYVKRLEGTKTHILDTRKTTPGLRMLEKQAVKIGGGMNHRIGLFDMILLKDNHIDFAGGIDNAIDRCHAYLKEKGLDLKIEIEVRSFDELDQVLKHGGVNRIMLDNFSVLDTKKAVDIIAGKYETESSGGITYDTIRDYAEQGVDFISVGALTLAMYIAYEELKVEDEAAAYDYYDTNKYWNLHTSGRFVKEVAKTHVIEMAVHDEIFYRQAMAEKLTLDEKEEEQLRSRQEDFWTDMTEEQQERLGVDKAEIDRQLEKAALAQKYQNQIAAENNSDFDGYSAGAEPYEQILKEHKYKLNEKLWDRVDFGNIILNH